MIDARDGTDRAGVSRVNVVWSRALALSVRGDNGGGEKEVGVLTALSGAFDLSCAAGALEDCGNIPVALDL